MAINLNRGTPPDPRWADAFGGYIRWMHSADALGGYINNTRYIHHEHRPNASARRK